MNISRDFHYDAAHRLPNVPQGHKCGRLHGHTYQLTVTLSGPVGDTTGWILDFATIDAEIDLILADFDHHYLNNITGLENPTVENQLIWLWEHIRLPGLYELTLREGLNNAASYQGEIR